MIETGEEAIPPILRRRKIGALKYLGKNIPRASKLLLANGLIIGKINYHLPLYGGMQEKYLQSLVLAWKTIRMHSPVHLANKIHLNHGNSVITRNPSLQNTAMGLRWRMTSDWNYLPQDIKDTLSLPRFKAKTKSWIKSLRIPNPGDPEHPQ